jgi:hypothetical protein
MSLKVLFFGIVAALVLGGALWLGSRYGYLDIQQLRQLSPDTQTTEATSANTIGPKAWSNALFDVTVVSTTTRSVTVVDSANQTSTFTLAEKLPVYSSVSVGEVGRGFDDIQPGTKVTLYTSTTTPREVTAISFVQEGTPSIVKPGTVDTVKGYIAAVDSASLTITLFNDSTRVTIVLASTTKASAVVAGGQTGYPMAVGYYVVANGVALVDGKVTAKMIVYSQQK